ncbi:hypothetical protein FB451DRAFT_1391030 [Mycena latifolia]|nr:hypothetical protein FB451DRAFT_1391030 [Mycena latifolia]
MTTSIDPAPFPIPRLRNPYIKAAFSFPPSLASFPMLSLSVELVQEIGAELSRVDLKRLRAVCKDVGLAINPLFFSALVLWTQHLRLETGLHVLTSLASGKSGWSPYAKTLTIKPGETPKAGPGADDRSDSAMQELLAAALGSLTKIRTVIWEMHEGDLAWQQTAICQSFANFPLLDHFALHAENAGVVFDDLQFPSLSGLRALEITSPYALWGARISLVHQIARVVGENRDLTSLYLGGSRAWSDVWTALREYPDWTPNRLTHIGTEYLTSNLLEYLRSYSGIRKLELRYPPECDDNLLAAFFRTVLPRHAATLVELAFPAHYESPWSFGPHTVDAVAQLHNLSRLEISVNKDDIAPPINVVDLLLRTAAALPIHRLKIGAARESTRTRSLKRATTVETVITEAVRNFRSIFASPPVVCVGSRFFERQPVDEPESGAESAMLWAYQEIPNPDIAPQM